MAAQIAVRLSDEELAALDWIVERCRLGSRAEGVRAALAELTARLRAEVVTRSIIEGYTRQPESPEELAEAERATLEAIAEEPWERWW